MDHYDALLQSTRHYERTFKECLEWWTQLIIAVTAHAENPDLQTQQRLSSLSKEDKLWKEMRRSLLAKLNQDMKNGKRLAEERDSNKRKFADMEAREQQVLELETFLGRGSGSSKSRN